MAGTEAPPARPLRAIWEREPVRVVNAALTFFAAVNAVMLGAGLYEGAVAAAITGIIAAVGVLVNELFTRAEVVPLKPLEDLAEADRAA